MAPHLVVGVTSLQIALHTDRSSPCVEGKHDANEPCVQCQKEQGRVDDADHGLHNADQIQQNDDREGDT
jgi:hypothetical protein